MKTIYIATAIDNDTGDTYQENAYTDPQRALDRARYMIEDIQKNLSVFNLQPSVVTLELYEDDEQVAEIMSPEDSAKINGQ